MSLLATILFYIKKKLNEKEYIVYVKLSRLIFN